MSQLFQREVMAKEYDGNPDGEDSVGLRAHLVEGNGIFAHLFDDEAKTQLQIGTIHNEASPSFDAKYTDHHQQSYTGR
jgi:hypothetical protein